MRVSDRKRALVLGLIVGCALGAPAVHAQAGSRGTSSPRGTSTPPGTPANGVPVTGSSGGTGGLDPSWLQTELPGLQLADGALDHSVHFYYIPAPGAAAVDGRHVAVLKQRISVAFERVPLAQALESIAAKAGLRVTYGTRDSGAGPLDALVTLRAENITIEAALTDVLADARLDVQLSRGGVMALVPQGSVGGVAPAKRPPDGRVTGQVVDTVGNAGIGQAGVRLDELNIGTLTDADGKFELLHVPPGQYQLTVRRVGFIARTVAITVRADSTTRVRIAIVAAPTRLNEVVSTALGDQRRGTLGNDISTIDVSGLAPTAPVTDLTDVLGARAPGVDVMESNGEVGNGAALRIRGNSSMVLSGDPIIIVDGVRVDNTPGGTVVPLFGYGTAGGVIPSPSRINDIDLNDVESIDILKGPSAATEYGTDAANGVIVIKTKHAHASGPPRWNFSAEQGWSEVGTPFPKTYYSYGHTTGANPQPVQCPLNADPYTSGYSSLAGTCKVDSLVQFTPLNNSSTTMFGTGAREKVDLSVSGGSDAVRYYAGGSLTNETGTLQMPPVFKGIADSVGLSRSLWNPNSDNQRSARANTVIKLAPTADMQLNTAYMSNYMTAPQSVDLYEGVYTGTPPQNTRADYWGWGPGPYNWPAYEYGQPVTQQTDRFTGGLTVNWSPLSWWSLHLTGGLDHQSQYSTAENTPAAAELYDDPVASLALISGTTDVYSLDFRTTAIVQLSPIARSTTSGGVQMVDTRLQSVYVQANGITTSNPTVDGATNALPLQPATRQGLLGGYVEEQLGLWDRLYLTGAIRIDDGSSFGSNYSSAAYPKASVSWLALTGGATTLRLRGAFGESGVQPPSGAAQLLLTPGVGYQNGNVTSIGTIVNAPNAGLEPERTNEFEGGADLGFLRGRINVTLTAYAKTTNNALVATGTGWELGSINSYENVGEVTNNGFEASISATLLQTNATSWDVTVNGSTNHNNLVKLAPGLGPQFLYGDHAETRFAPGTPLYGYAAPKSSWTDLNHDGIVETNEVTVQDSVSYVGASQPTIMASIASHLSLFHGVLAFGTLFDYRGGFRLMNTTAFHSSVDQQGDLASNSSHAPIWEQERDAAVIQTYTQGLDGYAAPAGFYEDASYVRWRELSATLALPEHWARFAHVKNLSLTGAVRNVFLWTPFTGGDPEVTASEGVNTVFQPTTGQPTINRDLREQGQAIPLSRYFILRLNAGF
jgi:TonB-linked SusC/RagA family outer membrane protein